MMIPVDRITTSKLDADAVAHGKVSNVPSDHMFYSEFSNGEWRKSRVQPYRSIPLAPFALGLHYAQAVFEGMKAYRQVNGNIVVFRMESHFHRFNRSLKRMMMPQIPEELFVNAINTFLDADRDWVPSGPDSAFYIRPLVFATEERMGLKSADEFMFIVVGGPFKLIYTKPLRVKVERTYSRAASGGTGSAKCAGNYAAAMYPTALAREEGFDQVIWTDAATHSRVEESGTMNVAFIEKNAAGESTLITPELTDTILDGITRDSVLTIARDAGIRVQERIIMVDDLRSGLESNSIVEAFGIGTAASIAPINCVSIDGHDFLLEYDGSETMLEIRRRLNAIRYGETEDIYGWMNEVESVVA